MDISKLISASRRIEIHIDLYGFSEGWIETIQNKILSLSRVRQDDEAEAFTAWAAGGVSVRFTTDEDYAPTVLRTARQYLNLASRTYRKLR